MSGRAAARDPDAAKRRYLASGRQEGRALTLHGADIAAFLPVEPAASFIAAGKVWYVKHARNVKGLRTFLHIVALFTQPDEDPKSVTERNLALLGVLVGGKWEGDRWVSDLPAAAADELSRNELDDMITLATTTDGRPRKGEAATGPHPSAASSPSTAASIPETPTES